VSLLGLAGRPDESSYLVTELKRAFPGSSVASIVHTVREIQNHATALGIVGGAALLWTSLSLFSVLESAFNIVYGQPNRSFLRGKLLAVGLLLLSLVTLFVGLLAGSVGFDLLKRYAGFIAGNSYVAYGLSVAVSLISVFLFLVSVYYLLTNVEHTFAEVLPGAVFAAVALEASFQVLPLYVRFSSNVVALKAFGGPALLLVWLYVMANVIVFGAEVNWWLANRREPQAPEEAAGLA
jgi:membrane protein